MSPIPAVVYTDLDGTLLDHHNYNYRAAQPAIEKLCRSGIPIIFNTSKTIDESVHLANEMNICHPLIVENGGAVVTPSNYQFDGRNFTQSHWVGEQYDVEVLGSDIESIRKVLSAARQSLTPTPAFRGFSDLTVEEIAELTGLSKTAAREAKHRRFSEPFEWLGDEDSYSAFVDFLSKNHLRTVAGGRFHHVIGQSDKRTAMVQLHQKYEMHGQQPVLKVAFGDSENDVAMLESADIAVVVKNTARPRLELNHSDMIRTSESGPLGWHEAVRAICARLNL